MSTEGAFIGQVARQTGLSIHAIRFYEAEGLLPERPRTESGYRIYHPECVGQLKFIHKAQGLGFSLAEIRELLVLRNQDTEVCSHVKAILEEKLASVRAKRRELEKIERELSSSLAGCVRQLKGRRTRHAKNCPVLTRLGRGG